MLLTLFIISTNCQETVRLFVVLTDNIQHILSEGQILMKCNTTGRLRLEEEVANAFLQLNLGWPFYTSSEYVSKPDASLLL